MSEVQDKPVAKPEVKRDLSLIQQRMGLAEHMRQDWVVNAEEGTTVKDVLQPSYWAHVSAQMQRFDHVQVRMETGEWIADLFVIDVGRNWAKVHLAHLHELEAPTAGEVVPSTHEVKFLGPQHKWSVIRISDKARLQAGFTDRGGAEGWLKNHLALAGT